MSSSADLRRWAQSLRLWANSNPYPKTVAQMIPLAYEFEQTAEGEDARSAPVVKLRRRVEKQSLLRAVPRHRTLEEHVSA